MVGVEGIAEWIGREVVDRDGEKVGKLQDVYYDTTDHAPVFVAIKSGAFGRSHSVAPLTGATLSRDYVRLDAPKDLLKDAPHDASGGRLTGVDAVAVLRHFALPADRDLDGETRVCFQTAGAAEESERKRAEVAAEQEREAGAGATSGSGATRSGGSATQREIPQSGPEGVVHGRAGSSDDAGAVTHGRDRPEPERDGLVGEPAGESFSPVSAPDSGSRLSGDGDDKPASRLDELERRVAALEARLDAS